MTIQTAAAAKRGVLREDVIRLSDGRTLGYAEHGIERAYVGGLSMGGMIAQEFALQHPDRVKALLLFDTGAGGMGAMQRDSVVP